MEKRPLDSFEFFCSISVTLLCEIGSTMAYVKDNDFLFVNPNVIHKSLENPASFLGFAVLVPVAILQLFLTRMIKTPLFLSRILCTDIDNISWYFLWISTDIRDPKNQLISLG